MDIEYLLFLQGLRESLGFTEVVAKIFTAMGPLSLLIPAILFWCFNKRAGLFLMFVSSFGRLINILVKDTFCVYRPWILDSAVNPGAEAMKKASSYSFPSGHTQFAAANFGGLAYFAQTSKTHGQTGRNENSQHPRKRARSVRHDGLHGISDDCRRQEGKVFRELLTEAAHD